MRKIAKVWLYIRRHKYLVTLGVFLLVIGVMTITA